jgi:2'-5' RNA ligase
VEGNDNDGIEMQLELDFGEPCMPGMAGGAPPLEALYFAALPDERAARLIVERGAIWRADFGLSGRLYTPDRLHVSLNPLGRYVGVPQQLLAQANAVGMGVTAPAFDVALDRLMSFGNGKHRALVLCCGEGAAGFDCLLRQIALGLKRAGLPSGLAAGFTPHLTLLWDRLAIPDIALESPIAWRVREFVLVHSLLGRSRHEHLGRWPLRDPSASLSTAHLT